MTTIKEIQNQQDEVFLEKFGVLLEKLEQLYGDGNVTLKDGLLSYLASRDQAIIEGVREKIDEIQTELHNGRMETAYNMVNKLLSDLT